MIGYLRSVAKKRGGKYNQKLNMSKRGSHLYKGNGITECAEWIQF